MKVGDVVHTQCLVTDTGEFYWFESDSPPGNEPPTSPPPGVELHGPFKTVAELTEHQRCTLLGRQGKFEEGGMWDPAWNKPQ
jgi:hypothetical protein